MTKKATKKKEVKIEATAIVLTLNKKEYPLSIAEARRLKDSLDNIFGRNQSYSPWGTLLANTATAMENNATSGTVDVKLASDY